MQKKLKRGLFIVFEGIDGTGKSTQLNLTAQRLQDLGYDVLTSREPGGTALAEKVRALVLDAELPLNNTTQALLYLAARSEHVEKVLRPAAEAGKIILCDRFAASTLVYQGLAAGKSAEEIDALRRLNAFATGGFAPELTLLLDGEPERLLARRQARGVSDRYEAAGLDFQRRLRRGFLQLAADRPESWRIIDAQADLAQVTEAILRELLPLLAER